MSFEEFPKHENLRIAESLERRNKLLEKQNEILSNLSENIRDIYEELHKICGGL
jgi:uncharacterized protein YaaN involved in tellurite resistance